MKCFTIDKDTLSDGIDPDAHDCLLAAGGHPVASAVVRMVPVLPPGSTDLRTKAQLSLSFVLESPDDKQPGCILSVDPREWNVCLADNPMVLLDPCGPGGRALLMLPPGEDNLLVSMKDAATVLGTDDAGRPVVRKTSRAMLMLSALGAKLEATAATPAPGSPRSPASPRSGRAGAPRTRLAKPAAAKALERSRRKGASS